MTQRRRPTQRRSRSAMSLLEVILAIAILGTSMTIIGQLFYSGYRSAVKARNLGDATMICDSVMAELAAGSLDPSSNSSGDALGFPGWNYTVDSVDSDTAGLLLSTVSVRRSDSNDVVMAVVRMLPDPNYEEDE